MTCKMLHVNKYKKSYAFQGRFVIALHLVNTDTLSHHTSSFDVFHCFATQLYFIFLNGSMHL